MNSETRQGFKGFQDEVEKWQAKNFPNSQPYHPLLGLNEEVGELNHAHLKGEQGIRHDKFEIHRKKKDAIGDIMLFLIDYCRKNNLDLVDCLETTWEEVKLRDWVGDPMGGKHVVNEQYAEMLTKQTGQSSSSGMVDFKPFGFGVLNSEIKEGF